MAMSWRENWLESGTLVFVSQTVAVACVAGVPQYQTLAFWHIFRMPKSQNQGRKEIEKKRVMIDQMKIREFNQAHEREKENLIENSKNICPHHEQSAVYGEHCLL